MKSINRRNIIILNIGLFAGVFGFFFLNFSYVIYFFEKAHSPAIYSLLQFCQLFPLIIFSPITGLVLDSYSYKSCLVFGTIGQVILLAIMVCTFYFCGISLIILCLFTIGLSCFETVFMPGITSVIKSSSSKIDYSRVNALCQLVIFSAKILAILMAGFYYSLFGIVGISLFAFFCVIIEAICYQQLALSPKRRKNQMKLEKIIFNLQIGFIKIIKDRILNRAFFLIVLLMYFWGSFELTLSTLILDVYGSKWVSIIIATSTIGLILGNFLFIVLSPSFNAIFSSLLLQVVCLSAIFSYPKILTIMIASMILGACGAPIVSLIEALFQMRINKAFIGRVSAIKFSSQLLAFGLGYVVTGIAIDYIFVPLSKNIDFIHSSLKFVSENPRMDGYLLSMITNLILFSIFIIFFGRLLHKTKIY